MNESIRAMLPHPALREMGYTGVAILYGVFTDGLSAVATAALCARSIVLARCGPDSQPAGR